MASGLPSLLPYQDASLSKVQQLVQIKTHVAGYFFDAIVGVNYSSDLTITSHPVQNGANVSDHAYEEPVEVTMRIVMSDAARVIDENTGTDENSERTYAGMAYTRSVGAYRMLRQLQREKRVFTIGTRLETFNNMMVSSISVNDDVSTLYGLNAEVTFKQIFIANEKVVKVSNRLQTTMQNNIGEITPEITGDSANVYISSYSETERGVTFTLSDGTTRRFDYPDDMSAVSIVYDNIKEFCDKYTSTNVTKFLSTTRLNNLTGRVGP